MSASLLEALAYHDQGFSLIPLLPGQKRPALNRMKRYFTAPPHRAEVEAWFAGKLRNLGLITGQVSQVLIVDVDGDDGYAFLRGMPSLPATPMVITPSGGAHYYFRRPSVYDVPLRTHIHYRPGIDLLGERRYALAPSSDLAPYRKYGRMHAGVYRWANSVDVHQLQASLANLPDWLLELWRAADAEPPETRTTSERSEHTLLLASFAEPRDKSRGSAKTRKQVITKEASNTDVVTCFLQSKGDGLGASGLAALVRDFEVAWRCAHFLGLTKDRDDIDRGFSCVLPGHEEAHPSANLHRGREDPLLYHDWHRRSGKEWYLLSEVYAALITGAVDTHLSHPSIALWQIRLYLDAQILQPPPVDLRLLPAEATATVRKIYAGFRLLLQCKWSYAPGEATMFSWRFAAGWCGVGERQAGEALQRLLRYGLVRIVGEYHRASLFLPG